MEARNIQDLQAQLKRHWTTNFRDYYSLSTSTIAKKVWHAGYSGGITREPFPPTELSKEERNELFYSIFREKSYHKWKVATKDRSLKECKKFIENFVEPIAPAYNWPFSFAFNRF